ncbi:MAG: helix-turn-helix domain-containing protein [Acidimicrobiia bacterium]|nr:helix-turn-helix domain-containing protein [Acidimicrobiia bacterium]
MASLLTTKDLQELLDVDKSTIYRMAEDGRLPALKVGRQWRFPADEIHRWLGTGDAGASAPGTMEAVLVPEAIQGFADLAAELFGVMAVVTDMRGRPLTEVSNPCGFFRSINDRPGVVDACMDGWRLLGEDGGLEPRMAPSHLGFLCARTFVRVGSELVGMLIVGGIAPADWPPEQDRLERIAASVGLTAGDLRPHVADVFRLEARERQRILDVLPRIADLISELTAARSELMARLDQIAALAGSTTTQNQRSRS